jgi:signal transduction histidine kinase
LESGEIGVKLLDPPLMPEDTAARMDWFVRVRWLAAVGVIAFAAVGRSVLQLKFAITPFLVIGVSIALYNTAFFFVGRASGLREKWGDRFAFLQVGMDILMLTILMYFGGGIENPFISYYLFHTIIAAILLPWRKVALQVLFASVCIAALAIAEFTDVVPHRHIEGLLTVEFYASWKFVAVSVFAIITTLWVAAVLASSVAYGLHEREKQLEQSNKALAEQDRTKSKYVLRVAHDLAEPAGMITSCLKVVTQGLTGPIPDKAMHMVERAQYKSEYLGQLVRDLLSLSRIKAARKIPMTKVDLPEIIDQVVEEQQPRIVEKSLTLEKHLPISLPPVYGNADAIHELFGNLVANAVKYTFVDGRVEVSASNTNDVVRVKIQDNGIGIPEEALPNIFEEFYRADNVRAEAMEGTGLGLSIVKQIIDAHGGTISVESRQGKGTAFSFSLPVAVKSDDQS